MRTSLDDQACVQFQILFFSRAMWVWVHKINVCQTRMHKCVLRWLALSNHSYILLSNSYIFCLVWLTIVGYIRSPIVCLVVILLILSYWRYMHFLYSWVIQGNGIKKQIKAKKQNKPKKKKKASTEGVVIPSFPGRNADWNTLHTFLLPKKREKQKKRDNTFVSHFKNLSLTPPHPYPHPFLTRTSSANGALLHSEENSINFHILYLALAEAVILVFASRLQRKPTPGRSLRETCKIFAVNLASFRYFQFPLLGVTLVRGEGFTGW